MSSISQSISLISRTCASMIPSASSRTRTSSMFARLLVRIAIEWCGIIAFMYEVSSTVAWLRTRKSASAKTTTLPPKIAAFTTRLLYIPSMKPSMITAIVAPITNAM